IQHHVAESAIRVNIEVAEDYGKKDKPAERTALLQAALLVAERFRFKGLQRELRTRLATQVAAAEPNALKTELIALCEALGETYVCEGGDEGLVHETSADTVEAAIKEVKGEAYSLVSYPSLTGFRRMGGRKKAHLRLLQLMKENGAIYANAGDPETFDPDSRFELGGFCYCFLLKGKGSDGKSLFVLFETAQT